MYSPSRLLFMLISLSWVLGGVVRAAGEPDVIKRIQQDGFEVIKSFPAEGGLTGYAGRIQGEPMVIYVTGDGRYALIGHLIDAQGNSLTESHMSRYIPPPDLSKAWQRLQSEAAWVVQGAKNAPRVVYAFTDPYCPYCHRFWEEAAPLVRSGKVQIRHVMVGVIKPNSIQAAAQILGAPDPAAALAQHQERFNQGGLVLHNQATKDSIAKVTANNDLMRELGVNGTPAVFYQDSDGVVRMVGGLPAPGQLEEILGAKVAAKAKEG